MTEEEKQLIVCRLKGHRVRKLRYNDSFIVNGILIKRGELYCVNCYWQKTGLDRDMQKWEAKRFLNKDKRKDND